MKTVWRWASALVGVAIVLTAFLRCRPPPEWAGSDLAGAPKSEERPQEGFPSEPEAASARREASPAAAPSAAKSEPTSPFGAVVEGRVLSDVETSLIGARITLQQGEKVIAETVSREAGRYELLLSDLPCGVVELRCQAPGHRDERLENVAVPGHYDFALEAAGPAVYGSVIGDRFAEPISGAVVWLWDERGSEALSQEVTDQNGRFAFTRLGTGLYRLSAAAAGYVPVFEGVLVLEGQAELDVTMRLGWSDRPVQVQVIDKETSMPVEAALVTSPLGESYRTDAGGTFVHAVQSKAVMLEVTADGFCRTKYLLRHDDPAPVIERSRR